MKCVLERLYATICRDPTTGDGGLTPTESDFHSEGFRRLDDVRIAQVSKGSSDRLVEIDYGGTEKYQQFANGTGTKRRSRHKLLLRIGYFAGDNHNETMMVIASDDKLIGTYLQRLDNIHGSCEDMCLEKLEVGSSEVVKLDNQRYELQLSLVAQVL